MNLEELEHELLKKTKECELAANIGQMLVEENERLKREVALLTPKIAVAAEKDKIYDKDGFDASFASEIHSGLLFQTRQMARKLDMEYNLRVETEQKLEQALKDLNVSENKSKKLKLKNDALSEQLWSMQSQIDKLENQLKEADLRLAKMKVDKPEWPIDFPSVQLESPRRHSVEIRYLHKNESLGELSDIEKRSASPLSSIHSILEDRSRCIYPDEDDAVREKEELLQYQAKYEDLLAQNRELKTLLDISYDNIERLQNESLQVFNLEQFQVQASVLRNLESELEDKKTDVNLCLNTVDEDESSKLFGACESLGNLMHEFTFSWGKSFKEMINECAESNEPIERAVSEFLIEEFEVGDNAYSIEFPVLQDSPDTSFARNAMDYRNSTLPFLDDSPDSSIIDQSDFLNPFRINEDETPKVSRLTRSDNAMRLFDPSNLSESLSDRGSINFNGKAIESLTYTMIGSWFLKYNRNNKNPQLRFVWTNPYNRTINWAEKPPSDLPGKCKSAYFSAIQWRDPPASTNFPPTEANSLYIATKTRIMKLTPISWEIHNNWVQGVIFLLKRSILKKPLTEQFKLIQDIHGLDEDDSILESEDPLSGLELLSGSDKLSKHRRVHTMITHENSSRLSTPIRDQHRKLTVLSPSTKLSDKILRNTPIQSSESFVNKLLLTPRKLSQKFKVRQQ